MNPEKQTSSNDSHRPTFHDNANLVLGVLSFVVTVIFAMWGIILTKRYGDNKDQINKLSEIVEHQNEQNKKSDKMISKLIVADSLSEQANNELKVQTMRLTATVTALDTQLTLIRSNRQDEKYQAFLLEKKSVIELQKMLEDLTILSDGQGKGAGYFEKLPTVNQKDFAMKLRTFLDEYAGNSLLIEDDTLLAMRTNLYDYISIYLGEIDIPANKVTFEDFQKDGTHTEKTGDSLRVETLLRKDFMEIVINPMIRFYFRLVRFVQRKTKEINERSKFYLR